MKTTDRIVWIEVTANGAAHDVRALLTDQDLVVVAEGATTLSGADEAATSKAEQALLSVLDGQIERGAGMLAGPDVREVRRFLAERLPKLSEYLHYRTIDVRTIRELVRRWYPEVYESRPGSPSLEGAIEELLHYRAHAFIAPEPAEQAPAKPSPT